MKFVVICQYQLLSDSLCHLVQQYDNDTEIVKAEDLESAIKIYVDHTDIDLIVFYINLSGEGWDELKRLRSKLQETPIMVIADFESDEQIRTTIYCGADGCVSTNFTWRTVTTVIERVIAGEIVSPAINYHVEKPDSEKNPFKTTTASSSQGIKIKLTPRQLDVLKLIKIGNSNKEIARELDMALSTVKIHCAAIFKELGVTNRTQAAMEADKYCNS